MAGERLHHSSAALVQTSLAAGGRPPRAQEIPGLPQIAYSHGEGNLHHVIVPPSGLFPYGPIEC